VAETFSRQVRERFPGDRDLLREASHLPDLLRPDQTTRGEFHRRGWEIENDVETDFGLLGFIKAKLGIRGSFAGERGTEETSTIPIDDSFRTQLLTEMLLGMARQKKRVPLLLIDNLDQIGEPEHVDEFLRCFLRLEGLPVVITVRSEFVSADLLREHREPLRFGPLRPQTLMSILERRLGVDCREAEELRRAGLLTIARRLSQATGNPLVLLRWLEYLCWHTPLRRRGYLRDLKGYVLAYHETIVQEVMKVARWFFEAGHGPVCRALLGQELGLSNVDLDVMERQGVLIPDDITRPREDRRYTLSPFLTFLKLGE